jgi:epoxyqueuosine reductase
MARHGMKRARAAELLPGTLRVISVTHGLLRARRCWPSAGRCSPMASVPTYRATHSAATITRWCATGSQKLAQTASAPRWRTSIACSPTRRPSSRSSTPSAQGPGLARQAHPAARSRRGLVVLSSARSYTDLPLPVDAPASDPTAAAARCLHRRLPHRRHRRALPARRAALHLLPHDRAARRDPRVPLRPLHRQPHLRLRRLPAGVPVEPIRPARSASPISRPARRWTSASLAELFAWTAEQFAERTAGSPIHRIGHERWLRNIAVALGNGPATPSARAALQERVEHEDAMVREHVAWALARLDAAAG